MDWSVWLMAPKIACKIVVRSLLRVLSLVEVLVDPDAALFEESPVEPDGVPLVELSVELEELLLLLPSNTLMMACSISWRRSDVVELLLDDDPLLEEATPAPPSSPPACCAAASAWLDDACETPPLCDCSRRMIKVLLEPLAPLIADMGDLFYFSGFP